MATEERGSEVEPGREDESGRLVREVTGRAIRRLSMLEVVIAVAVAAVSLLGGALVAFVAQMSWGWPFRTSWVVASLVLFAGPASAAWVRERRS